MAMSSGRVLRAALLVGAGISLAGCDTIREAVGNGKDSPDEFAIATKAPLIIPPDFNLRPPKPGAAPENQMEPTLAAQQSLFGADAATVASSMQGNMSQGEKLLLAYAGAQNADPAIRQTIATDTNKSLQVSSDSFTNSVLFWQKPADDPPLDADAEAKRLAAQKAGKSATADKDAGSSQKPASDDPTTVQKDKKKSGWFDWF
jgi:hypothetical protein